MMDKEMKTYRIPMYFTKWGTVEVEASSLEEAVKYAEENKEELPLPENGEYVYDSTTIDYEGIEEEYGRNVESKDDIEK